MLILTGPTAAGKNTIGYLLAKQYSRSALIDFDAINNMFISPHYAPWQGEEGKQQQELCIKQVCTLAESFQQSGREVIILGVVDNNNLQIYQRFLSTPDLIIIQLLPTFPELSKRFIQRGPCLTEEEFQNVYQDQCDFNGYNFRIDNTLLEPSQSVQIILNYLQTKAA